MKSWIKISVFSLGGVILLLIILSLSSSIHSRFTYLSNHQKGFNAYLKGRFNISSEYLKKASDTYPENKEIKSLLAASYYYNNDFTKAEELFSQIQTPAAKAGVILCDYGKIHAAGKATDDIRKSFAMKLKTLDTSDPNIIANTTALSCTRNLPSEEINLLTKLIHGKVLSTNVVAHQSLALAYNTLGCFLAFSNKHNEAAEQFKTSALFTNIDSDQKILEQNRLTAKLVGLKTARGTADFTAELQSLLKQLKGEELVRAQFLLIEHYLGIGEHERALAILDQMNPTSLKHKIKKNSYIIQGLQKQLTGIKGAIQRAKITEILEQTLKIHSELPITDQQSDASNILFHVTVRFLYIEQLNDKFEKTLYKAIGLFPEDEGFQKYLGFHLFNSGDRPQGLSFMKKSLALNPNQPDLITAISDIEARYFIKELQVNTQRPFTRKNPLIIIRYGKNGIQSNPEIRNLSTQGVDLQPLMIGNTINAILVKGLSSSSSAFSVKLELRNPDTGNVFTYNVSSESDIIPPTIKINSPSDGATIKLHEAKVETDLIDLQSGIDLDTLDILLYDKATYNTKKRFSVPVVRNGVYRAEQHMQGHKVANTSISCSPRIPIPGVYLLEVSVRDRKGNKTVHPHIEITITQ